MTIRTFAGAACLAVAAVALPSVVTGAAEPAPAATGWWELSRTKDRGGIEMVEIMRDEPLARGHVAVFPRDQLYRVRTVLASTQLVGGTGRTLTTTMCARVHCHAAVNGDRWTITGQDLGRPYGAVAIGGELISTQPLPPEDPYAHLLIRDDGAMEGTIDFPIPVAPVLASGDVSVPVGINRQPSGDQITVLDQRYNQMSRTAAGTVEYLMRSLGGDVNNRALAPLERREVSGPIPDGGVVVAANGVDAIAAADAWWDEVMMRGGASLTSGSEGVREIIGGSPLLLRGSAYWFPTAISDGRHPRTIIGWNATRVMLVTVDGRQPEWSGGLTLVEAAQLMRWLGATDALNLDGGGSATFVDHGRLANRPSDGTQRAAVDAIVVMPPENQVGDPPPGRSTDAACPPDRVPAGRFVDTAGVVHASAIDCLAWWGAAAGTGPDTYSPSRNVRRDQMATFLARTLHRAGVPLPANPPDAFTDDNDSIHEPLINALAAAGVITGNGNGTFSPSASVTRGQMATFLARAIPLITRGPLANTTDYFSDDSGHAHERAINQITEAQVAGGTADGTYNPSGSVRRDQMATFLTRILTISVEAGNSAPPS
ncbi:MAG: phosphodiester glycosidase family protein [Acidimicrobiales bacterium]